jgi:hypothetical protein
MLVARIAAVCLVTACTLGPAMAQTPAAPGAGAPARPASEESMLLTVFLKHDQSKPLGEINAELKKNGYYDKFPPEGVEIVSWYVVMGIGQIATLRFPVSRLREVNRILEDTAWGAYRTEFFPTYDYKSVAEQQRRQMRNNPQ